MCEWTIRPAQRVAPIARAALRFLPGETTPEKGGGRTWARTKDPLIKSQLLYQLSYASVAFGAVRWARPSALEAAN